RVADNVGGSETDGRDALHVLELAHRVGQPRLARVGQVDLVGIAADHHPAAHAEAGQKHLHLKWGGVLRLIEDDEGIVECTAAHERNRSDLYLSAGDAALDLLGWEHVVQRVVQRAKIRIYFLLHVAGKKPEPFTGFDRRTREDQPVDAAADQLRD